MGCFSVPLATAVVAKAASSALPTSAQTNPFIAKLGWLSRMMFGGSFLLAIEHVYHGEIIFTPPFLSAVQNGETAALLQEMATRGVAMAVLLTAVWAGMVYCSSVRSRLRVPSALVPKGA
jgi:hypothetical protein